MDPFDVLPAELRLEILLFTRSKHSIKQLIQASPTMLYLYMENKQYVDRKMLVTEADLDDDMVQDAVAIILFPPRISAGHSVTHYNHWASWYNRGFPNPLRKKTPMNEKDKGLVKEIDKLYHKMLVFVEDYLTKATAACPSREYLCLPHPGGQLTFKDRPVCTRLDVTQCNDTERRRFLRAFLRYELVCKFCHSSGIEPWRWHRCPLTKSLGRSEKEAIACVETYFGSLYKAILAQCGSSDLPESPTATLASQEPDLTDYYDLELIHIFNEGAYHFFSLDADELCRWLPCFGFDLATALVAGATAGEHGRAIVGQWLINLAKRGCSCGFNREDLYMHRVSYIIGAIGILVEYECYDECPGLYQMLHTRFAAGKAGCQPGTPEQARMEMGRIFRLLMLSFPPYNFMISLVPGVTLESHQISKKKNTFLGKRNLRIYLEL
ncbi:hypothetical protein F5Y10DRAFT_289449 [Nemania abortiva]|nr:hypothetical protein F5Y10DRAFT_289449 [Nemania abortiva]